MSPSAIDTHIIHEDTEHYLTSSISSLSSQRAQTSWVAKSYRNAAQLFLTRRLLEAYEAIVPLISAPEEASPRTKSHDQVAPVSASSKGTRIKVWSFYLTLIDAIIALGPEDGQTTFGPTKWSSLAQKAREGTIWDEIVRLGYAGSEGNVDGEIVANLVTLLLTHMPSQKANQARLESFLSASATPSFDIAAHMASSQHGRSNIARSRSNDGTATPRDLNTRLKIIELYTLHVLPRNEEWNYAREFISNSEVLDPERRDAFQHALQSLQEEQGHEAMRQAELVKQQQEQAERARVEAERRAKEQGARVSETQVDKRPDHATRHSQTRQRASTTGSSVSARDKKGRSIGRAAGGSRSANQPQSTVQPVTGLFSTTTNMIARLKQSLKEGHWLGMGETASLVKLLLLLLAFALAMVQRKIRQEAQRMAGLAWVKLRHTVGMGVKVSYV